MQLPHGTAINHAGGKIDACMHSHRCHLAMLRQGSEGLEGDGGARRRPIDHEAERDARVLRHLDNDANSPEIMRARPGWNEDEVSHGDRGLDRVGERRRSIDYHELDLVLLETTEVLGQASDVYRRKEWGRRCSAIPPRSETALGISIDDGHRSRAGALGFNRQMCGERRLARPALL